WKPLVVFALGWTLIPAARAIEEPAREQQIFCRFVDEPIMADGRPDESAWKSAEKVYRFYSAQNMDHEQPHSATAVRLLWDWENLYFLAEMEDKDLRTGAQASD